MFIVCATLPLRCPPILATLGLTFNARRAGDTARVRYMDTFVVVTMNLSAVVHVMVSLL